jgi:hypothetical protein
MAAQFGIDYYVARKTALDTRYTLTYVPNFPGTAADKTNSRVTIGFRFLF